MTEAVVDADLDMDALVAVLGERIADPLWRLENLYWIVNKEGKAVRFQMNDEQRQFVAHFWNRNIILKARQLGFSTLLEILELDQALFNANYTGVVTADTLPNAGKLFAKIEFAYDNLPDAIKEAIPVKAKTAKSSIEFHHGSTINVGVSARGGTTNFLHVSEMGKTAVKRPLVSEEIISGAFESVPLEGGVIVVESTAEGAAGDFYDLVMPALKRMREGTPETQLDFRLHFFPWYRSRDYRLSDEDTAATHIPQDMRRYFDRLQAELADKGVERPGFQIDANQRAWYVKKQDTLGRNMKREYPSTPEEAFEVATEGAVYGLEMTFLREKGRITTVPIDPNYKVDTFWDLGKRDKTAIWLHQLVGIQHRWVRYMHDSNRDLRHYWKELEDIRKSYDFAWGTHFLPHDADAEILGESITTHHRTLVKLGMSDTFVVPRVADLSVGINMTRAALVGNHWFDREGCAEGIKCLDGYQYEWDEKLGVWSSAPLHNWASHGADAWRQYAQGWHVAKGEHAAANDDIDDDRRRRRRGGRNWKTT